MVVRLSRWYDFYVTQVVKSGESRERYSNTHLRTVIIDDHLSVRRCLRAALEYVSEIEIVGEAGNGRLALEAAATLTPDLLLLDINMPEMTGLEVLKHLRAQGNSVYVIILSAHADLRYVDAAIQLGANGYVGKDSGPDILIEAIRSIQEGGRYVDTNIIPAAA